MMTSGLCYAPPPQLWNYVYFIIYLTRLHRSSMNGLETRIAQLMFDAKAEPDLSWMDLHKLAPWYAVWV